MLAGVVGYGVAKRYERIKAIRRAVAAFVAGICPCPSGKGERAVAALQAPAMAMPDVVQQQGRMVREGGIETLGCPPL